ncbi:hypothetical protein DL95DRAFT_395944, partial [Leptodontidium sp. 2 PMI_412]
MRKLTTVGVSFLFGLPSRTAFRCCTKSTIIPLLRQAPFPRIIPRRRKLIIGVERMNVSFDSSFLKFHRQSIAKF